MKRWGLVVTTFYLVIVVVCYSLALSEPIDLSLLRDWTFLIWCGMFAGGQALLLFLAVDTSQRRMPPRQKLWVSVVIATLFAGLLAHAAQPQRLMIAPAVDGCKRLLGANMFCEKARHRHGHLIRSMEVKQVVSRSQFDNLCVWDSSLKKFQAASLYDIIVLSGPHSACLDVRTGVAAPRKIRRDVVLLMGDDG